MSVEVVIAAAAVCSPAAGLILGALIRAALGKKILP